MSDNTDKIIDAVKSVTSEPVLNIVNQRLSNPFFLFFISTWMLCNWDRVLLLFFSFGVSVSERIDIIKKIPSNSVFFGISIPHTHTIWYPLIASLIYVIGSPFMSYLVDIIHNGIVNKKDKNDSERNNAKLDLKIEGIKKEVSYSYARRKAELDAEKINKEIEFDIDSLKKEREFLMAASIELDYEVKEKESRLSQSKKDYDLIIQSIANVRDELINKEISLSEINSQLISRQNKLDMMTKDISRIVLPLPRLGIVPASSEINEKPEVKQGDGFLKGLWEDNKKLGVLNVDLKNKEN